MSPSLLTNNQMDSSPASLRIFRALGKLAACIAGLSLALPAPVFADLLTSAGKKVYAFGPQFKVQPAPDFYAEVKMLLGESAVA